MGNKASSTAANELQELYPLPERYEHLKVLGEGTYGVVLKCLDRDTKETVAIKIAKASGEQIEEEACILRVLMDNKLDQKNIVKFHGGFWRNKYMVFENLDINLDAYLSQRNAPMCLEDIRTVMQQMATALDGLKRVGVIHTDLKTDNIMLVDRAKKPFKVKLIDFGMGVFRFNAKHIKIQQVPSFRAPENIFGFPYSEAIDVWSLGCVMAWMVFGFSLFPGRTDSELIYYMSNLLGPPPEHMITASSRSEEYFTKDASNQWIPKVSEEYRENKATDRRSYIFRSLDEMKTMRLEEDNATEAAERTQCIELLKATLSWDEKDRITPEGILNHPFITKCSSSPIKKPADQTRTENSAGVPIVRLPSGVIMVQPAPPHRRAPLVEVAEVESISESVTSASTPEDCNGNDVLDNTDDSEHKSKRKKNCVKRFFSWVRKRVRCCRGVKVAPM
ncbi:homeodomain-interacting protein kinase 2-like [Centropristis striata]|uniref:homeodomain-interacting protein kinase 2-like n=1 Tax=Centropristis striata TaxID=184440 RepID=UPI0027DECAAB|nr:homeodomain-interacting protein kinase 2-like [Centropristis striata]XP_059196132.1 homeodomain-interacting protein kinase 2-like [Centropristis striata]